MNRQITGRKFDCGFFFVAAIGSFAMAARYHFGSHTIFWWVASALCLLRTCILFAKIRKSRVLEQATAATTTESNSVRIEHFFPVPPTAVWSAWTAPEKVRQWFGSDPAGTVGSAQLDVRVGGHFEVSFKDRDGTEHTCAGVYAEVQPPSKLGFTWNWRSEPGIETFVNVRLQPQESGTKMHFEHTRLIEASTHDYAAGWRRTFEKLERVLSAEQ